MLIDYIEAKLSLLIFKFLAFSDFKVTVLIVIMFD